MKMLKLTHAVLGGTKGDRVAEAYRTMLTLQSDIPIEILNNSMHSAIMSGFSREVKQYAEANFKVEAFVVDDIIDELQKYNYL